MRYEIHTVRFACEGTYLKNSLTPQPCPVDMKLSGTSDEIEYEYRRVGWGFIDPFGIRHLCNRRHIEEMMKP